MSRNFRDFLVGLTGLVALGALAAMLMLFGELDGILHPRYDITISTDNAAGLRPGSSVELNGVPIGLIGSVDILPDPEFPVRIVAKINPTVRVPDNAKAYAATSLIGGSASLNFGIPNGEMPSRTFLASDGTSQISGPILYKLFEDLNDALDERMQPILKSLEAFEELAVTYTAVGNNLNELLRPLTAEELAGGAAPNLATFSERLNGALEDIHEALALARDWLGDEQIRTGAKDAIANANTLIEQATGAIEKYASLAESLEGNADEVVRRVTVVSDEIAVTLEDVRRLAALATSGNGTLALLLNNPDLYNSLNDAAVRLEQALIQAQLFIEKVKAEGLPIDF